jgi:hypothetical protein
MNRITIVFAGVAWISTLALAFMIGRASTQPWQIEAPDRQRSFLQHAPLPVVSRSPTPLPTHTASRAPEYPQYSSTIPKAFWGSWDEIVSDRCEGREARFTLAARTVANFEIESEVSKVKFYGPNEIDVKVTGYDDNKNQYNDTWEFKLVDGGRTLTGRKKGTSFFRKCP